MSQYISLSVKGDSDLRDRIKELSYQSRTPVGILVRNAINDVYGDRLEKIFDDVSNEMDTLQTKNALE